MLNEVKYWFNHGDRRVCEVGAMNVRGLWSSKEPGEGWVRTVLNSSTDQQGTHGY